MKLALRLPIVRKWPLPMSVCVCCPCAPMWAEFMTLPPQANASARWLKLVNRVVVQYPTGSACTRSHQFVLSLSSNIPQNPKKWQTWLQQLEADEYVVHCQKYGEEKDFLFVKSLVNWGPCLLPNVDEQSQGIENYSGLRCCRPEHPRRIHGSPNLQSKKGNSCMIVWYLAHCIYILNFYLRHNLHDVEYLRR